jgi:hypothetical protein
VLKVENIRDSYLTRLRQAQADAQRQGRNDVADGLRKEITAASGKAQAFAEMIAGGS